MCLKNRAAAKERAKTLLSSSTPEAILQTYPKVFSGHIYRLDIIYSRIGIDGNICSTNSSEQTDGLMCL
jgi:hypothetical protein